MAIAIGRRVAMRRTGLLLLALVVCCSASAARARQPNAEYEARRAELRAQVDGPVVLFGYTGREDDLPHPIAAQKENFYYVSGHDEPGAALIIVPQPPAGRTYDGPSEVLYLPPRDLAQERWEGPRLGPTDPGILQKTGFAAVEPFANLRGDLGCVPNPVEK